MKEIRAGTILCALLASGSLAVCFLATLSGGGTVPESTGTERTAMAGTGLAGSTQDSPEIPPVDGSAPAVTETATFALG